MLVNNAGIGMRTVNPRFMTHPRGFWQVPVAGFRAVIETNLTGYFLVAREVTPRLLAAGGGRIVNISVSQSTMHRAGFVPYGPSRAGSEALSRIMAADLQGTGVTVNLLLPGGATVTGMLPSDTAPEGRRFLEPSKTSAGAAVVLRSRCAGLGAAVADRCLIRVRHKAPGVAGRGLGCAGGRRKVAHRRVVRPGFDRQHPAGRILAEPASRHAARRPTPDHDHVS